MSNPTRVLLRMAIDVVVPGGDRLVFALDDTPTKRYGPHVEGAGIHHHPTPGPADQRFRYGPMWLTLSGVVRHAAWGTIGLPWLAMLDGRRANLASSAPWYKRGTKSSSRPSWVFWSFCSPLSHLLEDAFR